MGVLKDLVKRLTDTAIDQTPVAIELLRSVLG